MDPSLSSSSTEDVSQLSPAHDNNTEISSSDIIKSKRKAPESSSDNKLEAGSGLGKWKMNDLASFVSIGSEWEEDEFITVKDKAGEDEEKMNIHKAICLKCSEGLKVNADNVLKMKCECKTFALIHDSCSSYYKDCSNCKQPFEYVPVTLLPSEDSHPTSPDGKVTKKCCMWKG